MRAVRQGSSGIYTFPGQGRRRKVELTNEEIVKSMLIVGLIPRVNALVSHRVTWSSLELGPLHFVERS